MCLLWPRGSYSTLKYLTTCAPSGTTRYHFFLSVCDKLLQSTCMNSNLKYFMPAYFCRPLPNVNAFMSFLTSFIFESNFNFSSTKYTLHCVKRYPLVFVLKQMISYWMCTCAYEQTNLFLCSKCLSVFYINIEPYKTVTRCLNWS